MLSGATPRLALTFLISKHYNSKTHFKEIYYADRSLLVVFKQLCINLFEHTFMKYKCLHMISTLSSVTSHVTPRSTLFLLLYYYRALSCVIHKSVSLRYEPSSEPLHIAVASPHLSTQGASRVIQKSYWSRFVGKRGQFLLKVYKKGATAPRTGLGSPSKDLLWGTDTINPEHGIWNRNPETRTPTLQSSTPTPEPKMPNHEPRALKPKP